MAMTFSPSSSADYLSVVDDQHHHHSVPYSTSSTVADNELRVYVYRSVGWSWMMKPLEPTFRGPRPVDFPQAIDVFLWGGLSTALHEGLLPLFRRMILCLLVFYFVVLMVCTIAFADVLIVPGHPVANVARLVGLVLLTLTMAHGISSFLFLGTIHDRIDDAIHRVSIPFRHAGYDLSVETMWSCQWRGCCCFGKDCYIRIIPLSGGPLPLGLQDDYNDNNDDFAISPLSTNRREFQVAIFWSKGLAGLCGSASMPHFSEVRDIGTTQLVDSYTWGAIATQLQPLMYQYVNARTWTLSVGLWLGQVLVFLPVWMPQRLGNWEDSWWFTHLILGWFFVVLCSYNWVTRFVLETVLRRDVLGQMKQVVDELSPKVESRSGYTLQFELIESLGGFGSTGAFVRFLPSSNFTPAIVEASATTSTTMPTAAAAVDWHKRNPVQYWL